MGLFVTAEILVLSTLELWCLWCWCHHKSYKWASSCNSDTSSDPKRTNLTTLAQQVIVLQLLTKCILCPIGEQDLRVG